MHVYEYVRYFILHTKMFHAPWFSSFLSPLFPKNRAQKVENIEKVPHNQNSPFRFIVILDTTKTHKLNILRLNLRFTGQLHQHIHTYIYIHSHIKYIVLKIYTQINTQTYIRLISKEYLSSSGIYKLIKVFLNISPQHRLYSWLLRRSFFRRRVLKGEKKSFTSCHNLAFHFTSSHSSISTYNL